MRKRSALDALFPKTRQAILAATLMDPERQWSLSELARHLRVPPSSLQRELARLAEAGILSRGGDGYRTSYRAEAASPIFNDLRGLLLRTVGLREVLIKSLERFGDRIRAAFVFGSVARNDEHARSDIDLMVIGRIGLSELAPALRGAEGVLLRPVNPSVYTAQEAARKLDEGHHFLTTVMGGEKLFIVGGCDDLEAALGRQATPGARDEQARTR